MGYMKHCLEVRVYVYLFIVDSFPVTVRRKTLMLLELDYFESVTSVRKGVQDYHYMT